MNITYDVGTLVTIRGPFITGISRIGLPFEIGIITKVFLSEADYLTPVYQVYFLEARAYSVVPTEMLWPLDPLSH
tara:strand:+ start:215 stop:439 length:225 start_codon:yes stop_codon:yes gene_type:complete